MGFLVAVFAFALVIKAEWCVAPLGFPLPYVHATR